jgi:hypothetical protein
MARRKCPVCKLYVGATPHSGTLHDRIRINRRLMAIGKLGRGKRRRRRR